MRFEQARDLYWRFFPATREPRNQSGLGNIRRHCQADAAKNLNTFGDVIHEFVLLAMMLVKKQMQLVEGVASYLPMMLFVHVAQSHRIREKLVEVLGAGCADPLIEGDRQLGDLAVRLDFGGMLVLNRTGFFRACFQLAVGSFSLVIFGTHGSLS